MSEGEQEKIQQAVFERMVRGESRESLLGALGKRLDETQASLIVDTAAARIEHLKETGLYDDVEFAVFTQKSKPRSRTWHVLAVVLITLGVLSSLLSTLLRGTLIVGIMPILIGGIILAINTRRQPGL